MPNVTNRKEIVVTLSDQDVRNAVEHAAWTAAVNAEPGLAVTGDGVVAPYGDGYRVSYIRLKD